MRLFLGIFPPKEVLDAFLSIQKDLSHYSKYLRFTQKNNIHLTLKFLGNDVGDIEMAQIMSIMNRQLKTKEGFNLKIKDIQYGFPGRRFPKILYVSVHRNSYFELLLKGVNEGLEKVESIEEYDYGRSQIFHFTLARTKKHVSREIILKIRNLLEKVKLWEGFRVSSIDLVVSELKKEGPVYKKIKSFKLAA